MQTGWSWPVEQHAGLAGLFQGGTIGCIALHQVFQGRIERLGHELAYKLPGLQLASAQVVSNASALHPGWIC
jgi:hypothetical protein